MSVTKFDFRGYEATLDVRDRTIRISSGKATANIDADGVTQAVIDQACAELACGVYDQGKLVNHVDLEWASTPADLGIKPGTDIQSMIVDPPLIR